MRISFVHGSRSGGEGEPVDFRGELSGAIHFDAGICPSRMVVL